MSHRIDPRRLGVEPPSEARHAIDTLVGRISPTAQDPAMTIAIPPHPQGPPARVTGASPVARKRWCSWVAAMEPQHQMALRGR